MTKRDDWSEHQPSWQYENEFIRTHGIGEYAKWHLGIDREKAAGYERGVRVSLR